MKWKSTMRPVRHRRLSEDSTSNLKKSVQPAGLLDGAEDKPPSVKSNKRPRAIPIIVQKNCAPQKLKVRTESHCNSKEKCPVPKRKNELSILIDANIEHYSGRRRRGSIDMKAPRAAKVASESPKKVVETKVTKRELRNGREANYLVDVSDDESPPPKKKIKREPIQLHINDKKAVKETDSFSETSGHIVRKRGRPLKQLKKDVFSDDSLDAPPPDLRVRKRKVRVIQVLEKKEVFSDESLDAPVPPRKKPRDFQKIKQRAKLVKKETPIPVMPPLSIESGYQSEFVKSVLQKRSLLQNEEKPIAVKSKAPKRRPRTIKPSVQDSQSPLIPATVPVSAFSPNPVLDFTNKFHFTPYPVIADTGLDEMTRYSFECLPQSEVWFHTYIRQDLRVEQSRFHNVYPVKGGDGFCFELPYEMPISRIIQKSNKTPLKKSDMNSARPPFVPKRLLRHLGESSPDKIWEDSDASNHSNGVLHISENANDEPVNGTSESSAVISDCQDAVEKKRRHFKKLKPTLDDFARKSPRCHASTLAMLSELRHRQCSDIEDSHSDSGECKSEKVAEPVKILEPNELESLLLKPVKDLNLIFKADSVPENELNLFECEFDEVLDPRQFESFTVVPDNLPSFPILSAEKLKVEKAVQEGEENIHKPSDADTFPQLESLNHPPDKLENLSDSVEGPKNEICEIRVSSRLRKKSENSDEKVEEPPHSESQISVSSKKSKTCTASASESSDKNVEHSPRSESRIGVLSRNSVKMCTKTGCETTTNKEEQRESSVKVPPKRGRGRPRINRTGWPTSRRKTPSRASISSVESQDSRLFLTPLPAECFDETAEETVHIAETKLCNGHVSPKSEVQATLRKTKRRNACKKK